MIEPRLDCWDCESHSMTLIRWNAIDGYELQHWFCPNCGLHAGKEIWDNEQVKTKIHDLVRESRK